MGGAASHFAAPHLRALGASDPARVWSESKWVGRGQGAAPAKHTQPKPRRCFRACTTESERGDAPNEGEACQPAGKPICLRQDGTDLYVDIGFALVKDEAGEVLGVAAVARDVTTRYTAERELRSRVAKLEAQLKALSSGGRRS